MVIWCVCGLGGILFMMGVFYDGSLFLWLCGFELVVNNSEEK